MSTPDLIRKYLAANAGLNDNHGPFVPKSMADNLRNMGITEGYVEVGKIPTAPEKGAQK